MNIPKLNISIKCPDDIASNYTDATECVIEHSNGKKEPIKCYKCDDRVFCYFKHMDIFKFGILK